jgi:hypothetical protein
MQGQLVFLFISIAVISAERVVLPGAYTNVNDGTDYLLTRVSIIGNKLLYTPFIETDPPTIPGQAPLIIPTRNVYVYDLTTKQQQSIALPHRNNIIFPVAFNDQLYIIDIVGSGLDVLDVDTLAWLRVTPGTLRFLKAILSVLISTPYLLLRLHLALCT